MKHLFFWQHKYQPVRAASGTGSATNKITGEVTEEVLMTDILYRCECGAVYVKTIQGRWNLDDVTVKK